MLMFADHKDSLRNDYGIRNNEIERSLIKNRPKLSMPMPAIGEVFCKINMKMASKHFLEEIERDGILLYQEK